MPRIPYDPTLNPAPAQKVPKLDASGLISAVGAEGRATASAVKGINAVVQAGGKVYADLNRERAHADKERFDAYEEEQRAKFNTAIKKVEVKDGVDFRGDAEQARKEYKEALNLWIQTKGNVRVGGAKKKFLERAVVLAERRKADIEKADYEFNRNLNIGAGQKTIEQGIETYDEDKIWRGVDHLYNAKAPGYESEDAARAKHEAIMRKADQKQTEKLNSIAFNDFQQSGDREKFRKDVYATPSEKHEQDEFFQKSIRSEVYRGHGDQIRYAPGLEDLNAVRETLAKDKDLGATYLSRLNGQLEVKAAAIEKTQLINARRVISESDDPDFDFDLFNQQLEADTDTPAGYPAGMKEELLKTVTANHQSAVNKRQWSIDKTSPAYMELSNNLMLEMFHENSVGKPDAKLPKDAKGWSKKRQKVYAEHAKRIKESPLGATAKRELWQRLLQVRIQDLDTGTEGAGWFFGADGTDERDYSQKERRTRIQLHQDYSKLIQKFGAWDTLAEDINQDSEKMRDFFMLNEDPSEKDIVELRETLNSAAKQKLVRERLRVSFRQVSTQTATAPARQPGKGTSEILKISSEEEWEALPAGARFEFNGRQGVKK